MKLPDDCVDLGDGFVLLPDGRIVGPVSAEWMRLFERWAIDILRTPRGPEQERLRERISAALALVHRLG